MARASKQQRARPQWNVSTTKEEGLAQRRAHQPPAKKKCSHHHIIILWYRTARADGEADEHGSGHR